MAFMPDDGAYAAFDRTPQGRRSHSRAASARYRSAHFGGVAVRTATFFAAAAVAVAIGLMFVPPPVETVPELAQRGPVTEKNLYLDGGVRSAVSRVRTGQ